MHDKTYKMNCAPSKDSRSGQTDQRLAVRSVVAKDSSFIHADSEDSDQTGQMPRLI